MSRRTPPTASQARRAAFDWLSIMRELLSFLSLARWTGHLFTMAATALASIRRRVCSH
jgi:hypothetical protein